MERIPEINQVYKMQNNQILQDLVKYYRVYVYIFLYVPMYVHQTFDTNRVTLNFLDEQY